MVWIGFFLKTVNLILVAVFVSYTSLTFAQFTTVGTIVNNGFENETLLSTVSPPTTTTELMITADSARCPVVIISPGFVSTDFGTSAQFIAIVESNFDPVLESKWLRQRSSITETIDINHQKFLGSKNLPSPELLINNVTFEDEANYQLQVRIVGGWCFGNTVSLEVRGILQFNDSCNATKECDQRSNLVCSSVYKRCMCNSDYYHRNRTCYLRSNLRAVYNSSEITTSSIKVWWNHPDQDADLVQSYNVSLREIYNSYDHNASAELQTNYTFVSSFTPSFLYVFEVSSNVMLNDPEETFIVKINAINLVVEPQPPGPIDKNSSNFHPQTLYLKWEKSKNSSYVNMYRVIIHDDGNARYTFWTTNSYSSGMYELEPGRNYTVQIEAICWYYTSYSKRSPAYTEKIETLRVPKVTLPRSSYTIWFLSNFEMVASVLNVSDFPPATSTKWQRNGQYININDTRYNGSTEDLVAPKLVINKVDFDNDHRAQYRCVATNSEGSWTSGSTRLYLEGNLDFLETCTRYEECSSEKHLTCRQNKCLCKNRSHYHKNRTCYSQHRLRVNKLDIDKDTCEATLRWSHPSEDLDLISSYIVTRYSIDNNGFWWFFDEKVSVGIVTQYSTSCTLQPGRLYNFEISQNVSLTDPDETIEVYSLYRRVVMEPLPPGILNRELSNFSANHLFLKWNPPDGNTTLNHYRVVIDGYQQQTLGSTPEIDWHKTLTPGTIYNVTITTISHGGFNSWWYPDETAESKPYTDLIEIDASIPGGYSYLSFGEGDEKLIGDDVKSDILKSPTTIYAGEGSEEGFNFVQIGSNGVIGLGEQDFNSFTIYDINTETVKGKRIICPFWTDLITSGDDSYIYFQTYQRGSGAESELFLKKANTIVHRQFGDFSEFKASWLVKVTWKNVKFYGDLSKNVTLQCLLITDGQSTFTVFNYIDVDLQAIENKNITIGYQYGSVFEKNPFSYKNAAFKMSTIPGNRGLKGFWIYKMTVGVPLNNDEKECFDWYTRNKDQKAYSQLSTVRGLIRCPCNNILLRFDPRYAISRYDRSNNVLCYASMITGRNAECCYRMHGSINNLGALERFLPSAGTLLQHNPFFERRKYITDDFKPREACCIKTKHCKWFYEVRPIPWCYLRSPFNPALNFGDPHIVTLDGLNYTFNGYGEYTMLNISKNTIQFDFQARTDLATTANSSNINATIFSAFVAQDQTGSKLQIDMSRDKTRMLVRVNEMDMTKEFENASFDFSNQNMFVRWENQTLSASFLQTSVILKVSLGVRFLVSEVVVDSEYRGHAKGLMGNFDGDATNDFVLPNGTFLDINATRTERNIYNNFGQKWLVNEKSLFHYDKELTFHNYTHLDFEPIFLDEVDKNQLEDAKTKCGPNPSQACIFDYLATGDIALAESSGTEEVSAQSDKIIVENESPSITGNTSINVEVNKTVYMQFNASDDNTIKPEYRVLKYPDGFELNQTTGLATWTPNNSNISEISISVIDSIGAESPSLDVTIVLCGGCGSHGRCDYDNVIPTENARYSLAACVCDKGYSGLNCELDTNACINEPCPLLRNCTDLTPEEENRLGRGYNCSDCPKGYNDIDNKCEDINECQGNGTNICSILSETCENTEGSYKCICLPGFRKDNTLCQDIDECLEKTSGCEQLCNNTPGAFVCQCFQGFSLKSDKTTCSKSDENPCESFNKTCEYTCDPTEQKCLCPIGYQLAEDGQSCTDVNECAAKPSPCVQECTNTNGSFQCYCRPGYTLDKDKVSCTECEEQNFGENCSQICTCGQGMDRCDPVSGCVCKSGWTGLNCMVDINECENETICENEKVCQNFEGSYQCNCRVGFKRNGDFCEDIDECSDLTLNECPDDTDCQNLHGNYTCNCKSGFQKNASDCEDVDECLSGISDCQHICINTVGGFNCECEFGYALHDIDRKTCEKVVNICALFPELNCSYGCRLEKKSNVSKGYCFCESGFRIDFDNSSCEDINECEDSSTCQQNCTNTKGSFGCSCTIGYVLTNDGKSCKECVDGLYGENCKEQCKCGEGSERCDHISGCVCKSGWTGQFCDTDINECNNTESPCNNTFEECINYEGFFQCVCKEGFERRPNSSCKECALNTFGRNCSKQCSCDFTNTQSCDTKNGTCYCKEGWHGVDCTEAVLRCANTTICGPNAKCSERNESYVCNCDVGYKKDATGSCSDIDECSLKTDNCDSNAVCANTEGNFTCSCKTGFSGDGHFCAACNSTHYGVDCANRCTCIEDNTLDCNDVTGQCVCKTTWNGTNCAVDVDECDIGTHDCNSTLEICQNRDNGWHCNCRYGSSNGVCNDMTKTTVTQSADESTQTIVQSTVESSQSTEAIPPTTGGSESTTKDMTTTTMTENTYESTQTTVQSSVKSSQSTEASPPTTGGSESTTKDMTITTATESTYESTQTTVQSTVESSQSTEASPTTTGGSESATNEKVTTYIPQTTEIKLRVVATFGENISLINYDRVVRNMESSLTFFYKGRIAGFIKILILAIRRGSTIVEHEVIAKKTEKANQDLVASMFILSKTNIEYDTENLTAISVSVKDSTGKQLVITNASSKCEVYVISYPCKEHEKCEEDNSKAYCRKEMTDSNNNFQLIIGLGVVMSLLTLAGFIGVIIICYVRRRQNLKEMSIPPFDSKSKNTFASGVPIKYNSQARYESPFSPHYWTGLRDGIGRDGFYDVYSTRESYSYDNTAQAGISSDFMYQAVQPNKKFRIKRPEISSKPLNQE